MNNHSGQTSKINIYADLSKPPYIQTLLTNLLTAQELKLFHVTLLFRDCIKSKGIKFLICSYSESGINNLKPLPLILIKHYHIASITLLHITQVNLKA